MYAKVEKVEFKPIEITIVVENEKDRDLLQKIYDMGVTVNDETHSNKVYSNNEREAIEEFLNMIAKAARDAR